MRRLPTGSIRGLALGVLLASSTAMAQTQIRARVLVMVDTSGSMTEHFMDNDGTGGDGSTFYSDKVMTRSQSTNFNLGMYTGFEIGAPICPGTANTRYDGVNSRIFAAKQALTNVVNGSGDIDWGLMRYSGTQCAVVNTTSGASNNCATDDVCTMGQFCIGGRCRNDDNLCQNYGQANPGGYGYGGTRTQNGFGAQCGSQVANSITYGGDCGSNSVQGSGACATPQVCYGDADCLNGAAGSCVALAGSSAKVCRCGGGFNCDTGNNWSCGAGNYCVWNLDCQTQNAGTTILVDPAAGNSAAILPWVDGVEALPGNLAGVAVNPELRAVGATPLAAAARAATTWYQGITDTKKACRPYVLVQMTDGFDTCDSDQNNGPIAAASSFVAATVPNAKNLNKVYVVGLAFGNNPSPTLDAIAHAGGTGQARLANSQQDIQAALADIVASSVLVEKCNNADDDCDGACDEPYPDVAVTNPQCSNQHAAKTCDNGYPAPNGTGTGKCYDAAVYVCSADQLSEQCGAQKCPGAVGGTLSSPAGGTMRVSNVQNLTKNMVGQLLFVGGAAQAANNGAFVIGAVGGTSVDVANNGFVADASVISYGVSTMQGFGNVNGNTLTLTSGSTAKINNGDLVYLVGGGGATGKTGYVVSATTATTITFNNPGTISGAVQWVDPRLCPFVEVCNGIDDDCNGVVDDCAPQTGITGSCCTSNCPACAKPPFVETCNGCDDDCDNIVDNHLVDTGGACGSNVGDCAPGKTLCCQSDPNTGACTQDQTQPPTSNKDKLWCQGGNPPYPTPGFDKCDGTDDNCNGVANDGPPQICYIDQGNGVSFPPALDGVGACHHGTQSCVTTPLGPGTPPCPPGWPAGKACPNPTPQYGTCKGGVGPHPEVCNGIDDDCNGIVDDKVTDAWLGNPCCSTGNNGDCSNAGGSMVCKLGGYQCVAGGKACVGSVAKQPETCNMIDDDCNGVVDDLPGRGAPCTGNGIYTAGTCRAALDCVYPPNPGASPNLVCVQKVGPMPETCNGLDDNCNGQVDDTNPPLAPASGHLPGVGDACDQPIPPEDKPPCKAGMQACVAGNLVCQGAVKPMPNVCGQPATNCKDNTGLCPSGYACEQGNCVKPCDPSEFPCPGGYVCNRTDPNCGANGCCIPNACQKAMCPPGQNCEVDGSGNANCVDPCSRITCPSQYICQQGVCVDGSCKTQGCPSGQVCESQNGMFTCAPDPCANVTCMGNSYCDSGTCVGSCAGPCPSGQYCDKGTCTTDPCAKHPCNEGNVCVVQSGMPVCIPNQCVAGCGLLQACCGGACISDPCASLHCPTDTHCALNSQCAPSCEVNPSSPKVEVVGAGGGGVGCAVGGGGASSASLAWLVLVAASLLWRRRRRQEVRR